LFYRLLKVYFLGKFSDFTSGYLAVMLRFVWRDWHCLMHTITKALVKHIISRTTRLSDQQDCYHVTLGVAAV